MTEGGTTSRNRPAGSSRLGASRSRAKSPRPSSIGRLAYPHNRERTAGALVPRDAGPAGSFRRGDAPSREPRLAAAADAPTRRGQRSKQLSGAASQPLPAVCRARCRRSDRARCRRRVADGPPRTDARRRKRRLAVHRHGHRRHRRPRQRRRSRARADSLRNLSVRTLRRGRIFRSRLEDGAHRRLLEICARSQDTVGGRLAR